ncbi:hypothetical protein LPB03_05995 [Polaribacter vadi]|uniref:Uncharacterized protein n=1 Tax=Polaribacter vadi TaxID=1774273 RepID=A0A1B8TX47_9FLAO|nr:DUF6607 family protein [Polaribacter vadi]AOW17043.1 hypothetical protein LPB03_05995 [Polaribacter vadi]OBY64045.1 hypothetical protein LPB3_06490 [Polaribacter vadi]
MKKLVLGSLLLFLAISINAQSKKTKDQNAIKEMCGCFEVTFNFAETFNYSKDSTYKPSETKVDKGLEWAGLVTDDNNKISIQHLLQVGNPAKPMIIKHWRQDWIYENTDFYMYNGDNNWTFEQKDKKNVKKQWTQKVYQVDDSPRYEGSGSWVHVDGKSYWENTTTAPLPRREYTKRSDYNITLRGNRQEITDYGWVHDQDNSKIIREAGKDDVVLANEKGYNTYKRVADSRCKAAADWWVANNDKWQLVRNKWDEVYSRNTNLSLETKVDNKPLYKHLFSDDVTQEKEMNTIIESFVKK